MPSTYTVNLGLEKVASGEKAGEWGNSLNTSLDSIDTSVNGAIDLTLPGTGAPSTPNVINIIDGTETGSLGRNKYINIVDSGDLGGSVYLKLDPSDSKKVGWIKNSLSGSRDLILFQGTYNASNDLVVAAGTTVLAKFDGGGASATVTNVMDSIAGTFTGDVTGNVTGTATTASNLDAGSTDEVQLPANTESTRPASPSVGNIRYNTSDNMLEVYKGNSESNIGNQWRPVGGFELIDAQSGTGNTFFADIVHRIDRDATTNGRTPYSYVQYKLVLNYYSTGDHDFYLYPAGTGTDNGSLFTTSTSYAMNYTARNFTSYYTATSRNVSFVDVNRYGDLIDAFASVSCQVDWMLALQNDDTPMCYNGQASYVSYNYSGEEQISNFTGNTNQQFYGSTLGFRAYITNGTATYTWALYGLRQVQE